jgi:hypothetical protein
MAVNTVYAKNKKELGHWRLAEKLVRKGRWYAASGDPNVYPKVKYLLKLEGRQRQAAVRKYEEKYGQPPPELVEEYERSLAEKPTVTNVLKRELEEKKARKARKLTFETKDIPAEKKRVELSQAKVPNQPKLTFETKHIPAEKKRVELSKVPTPPDEQIDERTGKPYGTVTATPNWKERWRGFIEREGFISGTLSFGSTKIAEGVDYQRQKGSLRQPYQYQPGGRTYGSADIKPSTAFTVARVAPYFTPVGPYIMFAEGAEAFGTSSGRERMKEQRTQLIEGGYNPAVATGISHGLPATQFLLGGYGTYARIKGATQSFKSWKANRDLKNMKTQFVAEVTPAGKGAKDVKIVSRTNVGGRTLGGVSQERIYGSGKRGRVGVSEGVILRSRGSILNWRGGATERIDLTKVRGIGGTNLGRAGYRVKETLARTGQALIDSPIIKTSKKIGRGVYGRVYTTVGGKTVGRDVGGVFRRVKGNVYAYTSGIVNKVSIRGGKFITRIKQDTAGFILNRGGSSTKVYDVGGTGLKASTRLSPSVKASIQRQTASISQGIRQIETPAATITKTYPLVTGVAGLTSALKSTFSNARLKQTTTKVPIPPTNVGQTVIQPPKEPEKQKSLPAFNYRFTSGVIFSPKEKTTPRSVQTPLSISKTSEKQVGRYRVPFTPPTIITPRPTRRIRFIPPLFNLGADVGFKGTRRIPIASVRGYTPSYTALAFGIRGKKPKKKRYQTGFEFRPITKDWFKTIKIVRRR